MPINLDQYKIRALATEDLVDGFNGALSAMQVAQNDMQTLADGAAALQISGINIVDYHFSAFEGIYPENPEPGNAYLVEIPGTIDGIYYPEGSLILFSGVDWFYSLAQEEGADGQWMPVIADAATGGNQATMTAPAAAQHYRREGRRVTLWFDLLTIDTTGMTAGNDLFLIGLPFTADGGVTAVGNVAASNVTFTGSLSARIDAATAHIKIEDSATGAATDDLTVASLTSGTASMRGTITYWI